MALLIIINSGMWQICSLVWYYSFFTIKKLTSFSSTAIHNIEESCDLDDSKYLIYWYFRFGDEETQSADPMVRSLIRQLSRSPLAESVTKLWEENGLKGGELESEAASELLFDVISCIAGEVYLVIDALDE
ncbi:hypothetical protein N7488_004632 [Penicillium malachiteum]|nr:hypothetical protein N7488_004632 [Penicillium malachiteum]